MESRDTPLWWTQVTAWEGEVAPDESVLLQKLIRERSFQEKEGRDCFQGTYGTL